MKAKPFAQYYSDKLDIFNSYFEKNIPRLPDPVAKLEKSMKYSLLAGGKRLRPILLLTVVECFGGNSDFALPFACALEYIHTYSLIHDDLPCMDDDELRRGHPTNHIVFGEDVALLAGDALLTHAFHIISRPELCSEVPASVVLKVIHVLSEKAGVFGMVVGQMADIDSEPASDPAEALEFIHANKTGALITASVQIGALLAEAEEEPYRALSDFGRNIGKCFQIQDDILDEVGDRKLIGKNPGSDRRNETLTYPALHGLEKSRELAERAYEKAVESLSRADLNTTRLLELADFALKRDH